MLLKLILWIIIFWLLYSLAKRTFSQLFGGNASSESNVKGRKQEEPKLYNPDDIVDVKYEEVTEDNIEEENKENV